MRDLIIPLFFTSVGFILGFYFTKVVVARAIKKAIDRAKKIGDTPTAKELKKLLTWVAG